MPRTSEALTVQYLHVRQRKSGTIIIQTVHILQHDSAVTGSLPDREFLPGQPKFLLGQPKKKDCVQEENECKGILVALGGTYMDKVMDVLLVHFQPNCLGNRKIKITQHAFFL
jgi:hypothetical protein